MMPTIRVVDRFFLFSLALQLSVFTVLWGVAGRGAGEVDIIHWNSHRESRDIVIYS
jgi:hypothetical protein